MITTFRVILLIIILITFIAIIGEKENDNLRNNATALCIASILAFVTTIILQNF